ncbi:MAG TPA: queuosine salvage family protein [Baekduia sp.]|nr:queuosine salvage family protein [Baekduia sp.]
MSLPDEVRRHCAEVARAARSVRIDLDAPTVTTGVAGLNAEQHFLEGSPEQVARYVLVLDTINFGSGWFPTLRHGSTDAMTERLTAFVRGRGGASWWGTELGAVSAADVAAVLDEDAAHPLMALYAEGLAQLGVFAAGRDALVLIAAADGSAARFAKQLAEGMAFFDDVGFFKRAQITANDLVLPGVATFDDVDRLTVFADNFLPHVLRLDGVLVLDEALATRIDRGGLLEPGGAQECELRACAVHACEGLARRLGVAPRLLDNWLWNRGCEPAYLARPTHLARTVFY